MPAVPFSPATAIVVVVLLLPLVAADHLMRPISVFSGPDVASPYAEVMFASGEKRKLNQMLNMNHEPVAAAAASAGAAVCDDGNDGASPVKKPRHETWSSWAKSLGNLQSKSSSIFGPINRFFRSNPNHWTPKSFDLSEGRLNGKKVTSSLRQERQQQEQDRRQSLQSNSRRQSLASNDEPVVIQLPESALKFKECNSHANDLMPELYKQLEQLEITNRITQVQEAESAVRQAQNQRRSVSSTLYSSFQSLKWTPPVTQFFIPSPRTFKPLIEEADEVTEEEESDLLQPELEVIEDFISDKYRSSRYGDVLIEQFDIPITRKDLETLEGLNWLNDEVINFYFQMIMSRSREIDNLPSVYVFSTFFYTKLTSSENSFNMLKRWTRKVDIFSHDLILVPLHLGMHWTLCCVNCRCRSISYYDSMAGGRVNQKGELHLKAILSYLQKEHADKKKDPLPTDWKINGVGESEDVNHNDRIPQQENGSDCGVFTCRFAEYISRRASFRFRQVRLVIQSEERLTGKNLLSSLLSCR